MYRACLLGIEVLCSGNPDVCKKVPVPLYDHGRNDAEGALWAESTSVMNSYIAI